MIKERLLKFVPGFRVTSLVFPFALDGALEKKIKSLLTGRRNIRIAPALASSCLETKFTDLLQTEGGPPVFAFITAHAFNKVWMLALARLLFGGLLITVPNIRRPPPGQGRRPL